jgi:hypothetical protein
MTPKRLTNKAFVLLVTKERKKNLYDNSLYLNQFPNYMDVTTKNTNEYTSHVALMMQHKM